MPRNTVFICETVALFAFGTAWLVKGGVLRASMDLTRQQRQKVIQKIHQELANNVKLDTALIAKCVDNVCDDKNQAFKKNVIKSVRQINLGEIIDSAP